MSEFGKEANDIVLDRSCIGCDNCGVGSPEKCCGGCGSYYYCRYVLQLQKLIFVLFDSWISNWFALTIYIVYDMAKAVLFYLISWIYHRIVLLIRYVLLNILYNMLFTILVYMICTHEFCLLPCIYLGYDTIWMHFNKICVQQGVSNSTLERAQSRMQIYKEAIWWVEIKQQR